MFYEYQEENKLVEEGPQKPNINLTTNTNVLFRQPKTKDIKEPPSQVASKKGKVGTSKRGKHQDLLHNEPQKLRITLTVNNYSTWPLHRDCQDAEMIDLDKIRDKFQDVQSEMLIEEETPIPSHVRAPQALSQQVSGLGLGLQYKKMFAKATGTTTPRNDALGTLYNNTDFDQMKEFLSRYGVSVKKLSKENIKRLYREMVTYLNAGQLPDYLLNEQVLI